MTTLGPYTALGHVFDVELVDGDDPRLGELLAPLASTADPTCTYRVLLPRDEDTPGWVEVDGERRPAPDLARARERLLVAVGRRVQDGTAEPMLHACVVDLGGRGVLVTGPSGAGKSTLTGRLAAAGGALVAEDLSVLDEQGRVRTYHRPLALGFRSMEALGLEVPEDDCRCGCMKHLVAPDELGGSFGRPVGIDLVVFCDATGLDVTPLSLPEALVRLFVERGIGNVDESDQLAAVASALAGARCASVGTADLDAAVDAIARLLDDAAPAVPIAAEPAVSGAIVYVDGEALIHTGEQVHHLDPVATAVWVLHGEGLGPAQIADELRSERALVDDTLERIRHLELPAPAR